MGQAQPSSSSSTPAHTFASLLSQVANLFTHQQNLAAFKIQSFYRMRLQQRRHQDRVSARPYAHFRILEEHFRPLVEIFFTSIGIDVNQQSRAGMLENICKSNQFRFKMRDLNGSSRNQKKLQLYLTVNFRQEVQEGQAPQLRDFGLQLPVVVINEVMVGGEPAVQDLVDEGVLPQIYEGQYLRKCMKCKTLRKSLQSASCSSCLLRYEWFRVRSEKKEAKQRHNYLQFLEDVKRHEQEEASQAEEDKDPSRFTLI